MGYIQINNLSKTYKTNGKIKKILSEINLSINKGEMLGIMGPSGSGKTTFLKILAGIEKFTSGEIIINNKKMTDFKQNDYDIYRQNIIGYIFQESNLLEGLTIKENILLPLILKNTNIDDVEENYKKTIKYANIYNCEDNYPEDSSGGEQQRAAICRALIKSPEIILADEPTANLDISNTKLILEAFININKDLNTTIIIVTHDEMVASYCQKVIFMANNRLHNILFRKDSREIFFKKILDESIKLRTTL